MKFIVENFESGIRISFADIVGDDCEICGKVSTLPQVIYDGKAHIELICDDFRKLMVELVSREKRHLIERSKWRSRFMVIAKLREKELRDGGIEYECLLDRIKNADTDEQIEDIYIYLCRRVKDVDKYVEVLKQYE